MKRLREDFRTALFAALAACQLVIPLLAQSPSEAPWIELPSARLEQSLKRLDPISRGVDTAEARIEPLLRAYEADPTPANHRALEGAVAELMNELSGTLASASTERETVQFAIDDFVRGARSARRELVQLEGSSRDSVAAAELSVEQAIEETRGIAIAYQNAEGAEKDRLGMLLPIYDQRREMYQQALDFRRNDLRSMANQVAGLDAFFNGFEFLGQRVDMTFENLELAAELLSEAATSRELTTRFLQKFEDFVGQGSNFEQTLEKLQTIEGKAQVLLGVVSRLGAVGDFAGRLQLMHSFQTDMGGRTFDRKKLDDLAQRYTSGQVRVDQPPIETTTESSTPSEETPRRLDD